MSESSLVAIKSFVNRIEAEVAHGALTAAGIEAIVSTDDAGGAYAGAMMPSVRLLVRDEDVERATDLLSTTAISDPEP